MKISRTAGGHFALGQIRDIKRNMETTNRVTGEAKW